MTEIVVIAALAAACFTLLELRHHKAVKTLNERIRQSEMELLRLLENDTHRREQWQLLRLQYLVRNFSLGHDVDIEKLASQMNNLDWLSLRRVVHRAGILAMEHAIITRNTVDKYATVSADHFAQAILEAEGATRQ